MNCIEFLHTYSDYRDGLITDAQALRGIRLHVARCAHCARYDQSLRRGIGALGDIEPSSGFKDRLRARLSPGGGEPVGPASAGRIGARPGDPVRSASAASEGAG